VRLQQRVGFGSALPQLPVHVLGIWRPSLVVRGAVEVRSAANTSRWGRRPDSRRCTSAEREVVVRLGHLFTGCTASLSRVDAAAYQRAPEMLRDFQKELKSVNPIVQGLLSWSTMCIASRATSFPVVDALRRGVGSSSRASAPTTNLVVAPHARCAMTFERLAHQRFVAPPRFTHVLMPRSSAARVARGLGARNALENLTCELTRLRFPGQCQ